MFSKKKKETNQSVIEPGILQENAELAKRPETTDVEIREKKFPMPKVFYYMNYKNIISEVEKYGGDFSIKKLITYYAIIVLLVVLTGVFCQLNLRATIIVCIFGVLLLPYIIINGYKGSYYQKKLSDASTYIEQVLYSFKSNGKILDSLRDVADLFPNGPMRDTLDEAINHILTTYDDESDVEAEALEIIETHYNNDLIVSVHSFMLKAEREGGNLNMPVSLLLEKRNTWMERILTIQQEVSHIRKKTAFSILISLGVCFAIMRILPYSDQIVELKFLQVVSTAVIALDFIIYVCMSAKCCFNWIEYDSNTDGKQALKDYYDVAEYDEKKEVKFSFKLAILPMIVFVVGLILKNAIVMVAGGLFTLLMLTQHKLGQKLLRKRLQKEITIAFPMWLMDVSLLLQTNNVEVAIRKAYYTAPEVLKPELEILFEKLDETPESITPYLEFMQDFDVPEIQSSMRMLYSLSQGSGGDFEDQIKEIIQHNNRMMQKANALTDEDSTAALNSASIYFPLLVGCILLVCDMVAFMLNFVNIVM